MVEVVSLVIGIVGVVLAVYFAWQATRDLKRETRRLRHLVNTVARGLDASGTTKAIYDFDQDGNLTNIRFHGSVDLTAPPPTLAGVATVTPPPRPRPRPWWTRWRAWWRR